MSKVFISYRREDTKWMARALKDRLCEELGQDQVFMDVDSIDLGTDFVDAIENAVAQVDVVIALIGKQWLEIKDDRGRRRLDNETDFVRVEVATALKRDIRLVPLLERGALMPDVDELPEDLKPLARRNALEISDVRFSDDVNRLIASLRKIWENDQQGNSVSGNEMVKELKELMDSQADESPREPIPEAVEAVFTPPPVSRPTEETKPVSAAPLPARSRTGCLTWITVSVALFVALAAAARFIFPAQLANVLPTEIASLMKLDVREEPSPPVDLGNSDTAAKQGAADEDESTELEGASESEDATSEEVVSTTTTEEPTPRLGHAGAHGHSSPHATIARAADPPVSTLSGVVFSDLNGNKVRDEGETVLTKVSLKVTKSDQEDETIITSESGEYSLKVPAGETVLRVDASTSESTDTMSVFHESQTVTVQSGADATFDVGIQPPGMFAAMVFDDLNGNGQQDEGEEGIPNIALRLALGSGEPEIVKTDETGQYCVSMPPGDTHVAIDLTDPNLPPGSELTTELPETLNVPAGDMANLLVGFQQRGTLQGVVFGDRNSNGTQDEGEPGIADIELKFGTDGDELRTVATDASGKYSIAMPPGEVVVTVDESHPKFPAGATVSAQGSSKVELIPGERASKNFGLRLAGTLTGVVFHDMNGNGKQDAGEEGIPDVRLAVRDSDRNVHPITADDQGHFLIALQPGTATVAVDHRDPHLPKGATITEGPKRGASTQATFDVVVGEETNYQFGFQQQVSLKGVVFNDINANRKQDSTEPGVPGAYVKLLTGQGSPRVLISDDKGRYEATVRPGQLSVEVDLGPAKLPAATVLTTSKRAEFSAKAGEELVVAHGVQKPAREVQTKDIQAAADYEKLLAQTNKQGVPLVLFLNRGPVSVLFPAGTTASSDKQQLPAGTLVQVTAFKKHKGSSFLWVALATKPQGKKQDIGGYVTVDQLSQIQPANPNLQGQQPGFQAQPQGVRGNNGRGGIGQGIRNVLPGGLF